MKRNCELRIANCEKRQSTMGNWKSVIGNLSIRSLTSILHQPAIRRRMAASRSMISFACTHGLTRRSVRAQAGRRSNP
jgi:hypothetical protein